MHALESLPYPRARPIPRQASPTLADFRTRWQAPRRPVVLTGVTDAWPARRWSPESLATRYGAYEIPTYVLKDGRVHLDPSTGFVVERMSLAHYIERALDRDGEVRWYLRAGLDSLPPAIAAEIGPLPYARGLMRRQNLWFAAPGTITHLHFDLPFNLVAQLYGRKHFILFAPEERPRLHPHRWLSSTPHLARIDAEHPDFERHPALRDAVPWHCTLDSGDVLFIPPRWWHYARALDPCISVNTWWSNWTIAPVLAASDTYKWLRGLNI